MSQKFEKWFSDTFKKHLYTDEEYEELKTYTWLAWRDSRREFLEELREKVQF